MPTATRTFRVFVSSTFEDLKDQRNVLQEKVFPRLEKFCLEKGARFQAIDLRWGVREEAGLDHKTMEICLAEIARCQKTGIKPNFIVLLGDRYGWRPLPPRIRKDEFETVLAHIGEAGEREFVQSWYELDFNAQPPEYLLKRRGQAHTEWAQWEPVERAHSSGVARGRAGGGPSRGNPRQVRSLGDPPGDPEGARRNIRRSKVRVRVLPGTGRDRRSRSREAGGVSQSRASRTKHFPLHGRQPCLTMRCRGAQLEDGHGRNSRPV